MTSNLNKILSVKHRSYHIWPVLLFVWLSCSGPLKAQAAIPDSTCNCRWKVYHETGKVKAMGRFKDNKKHGSWVEYDKDGHILSKTIYKEGVMKFRFLYMNGRKAERIDSKGNVKKYPACNCG